ncbi:UDP-N-acetylmuramoyl-L-alanine--D-glutamate ligase [Pseudovibrio sp. Tun.PSC04-5.I4]|uniref:UDP-N-acetylmuramoyl-L-alanine--D-glutamate ligase n=1 Tax=Pseudovibrio sp. Tun.PSC04-5.I4 TaxID=1798213 RepID=UPI00088E0636|nr:UDP-N-acetylmuramoyl-L-alanine--D-glutamate ligase [Pseudovibrio sp. Tun.PSC04-5.I4]SDR35767.1 UDP-N-acetylmuramoylalanine--D-glutamate ligase [Pseudovibrio sp. Tun.PSC04-5.I4]
MIPIRHMAGKEVALFGLGESGLVTARALEAGGARVDVWDDNADRVAAAEEQGFATLDLREAHMARYEALVVAPGVPLTHPEPHWSVVRAQEAGIPVIGDVELFVSEREAVCPEAAFVAITGTNGKSTTTALISHILKECGLDVQMGGNIGRPVLDLDSLSEDRVYVVEVSSYQIDLAPSLVPDIGVMLNLSPDHLDRHGDMDHYASIKERLVKAARLAVVGVDDDLSAAVAQRLIEREEPVECISCQSAVETGVYAEDGCVYEMFEGEGVEVADLSSSNSLRGAHNGQNAAAAVAVCGALGLELDEISKALLTFPGLAHRLKLVARAGKVLFVNDSKATNAEAAAHGLAAFDRIYWIAGGRPKAGGISSLRAYFLKVAKAYLIGEAADEFAQELDGSVEVYKFASLALAVEAAAKDAARDENGEVVVLLSPACASFDQFKSFEVRGDAFESAAIAAAQVLTGEGAS